MTSNEEKALTLAADRSALRKRLNEARAVLTPSIQRFFRNSFFDFEHRRLVGDRGLALQWLLRPLPELPISSGNQQTNRGTVVLRRVV